MKSWLELSELFSMAHGPDRGLDCLLGAAVDVRPYENLSWSETYKILGHDDAVDAAERHQSVWSTALPRFSASNDAIMNLIAETLPTWVFTCCSLHSLTGRAYGDMATRGFINSDEGCENEQVDAPGTTTALALSAAYCRARAILAGT